MTRAFPSLPIACTLGAGDLADRRGEWAALDARALRERAATPSGVVSTYAAEGEAELRRLAALEGECCGWATWSVERAGAGAVRLDVSAPSDAVPALHALFEVA